MKAILDHIGIAVRDLPAAMSFYRDALGLDIEPPEEVASQKVRAHFVPVGDSKLELLEATSPESAIAKYLEKRGPGLHHITLRVEDIHAALAQLKARGARLVDEQPRAGAEGSLVAFVHPSAAAGVLVELKQGAVGGRHSVVGNQPWAEAGRRPAITRFTVGNLELISVTEGFFRVDGGSMFGAVPKSLWEKQAAPDDRNCVAIATRLFVVRGARTMLIDAGLGDENAARFRHSYGVERPSSLDAMLGEAGLARDDIDIVIATHLHFDHAGGFTARDESGRLHPAFPRASYVVRRGEWEDATHPNALDRGRYIADNYEPLAAAGVLLLVDDDQTIMPGVRVRKTGGHTRHHQIIEIESNGRTAAAVGDLIPTAAHVPDAWIMSCDLYPVDTLAAKERFVADAIRNDTLVLFAHDPAIAAAFIRNERGARAVVPALT